jgi:dethiobiotin synthetase
MVTAALAALAPGSVAVVKPAQTGVAPGEPGDLAEVARLSGVTSLHEFARYPDPLSPHHAAILSGRPELDLGRAVMRIVDLANQHDLVLVEGAGGVMVPYNRDEWTLLDLAPEVDAEFVVVTAAGLGTLNHTVLTMRALEEVADIAGIVIGSWPDKPGLAELCNVFDLGRMAHIARGGRVLGALPEGIAMVEDFPSVAKAALAPRLGGTFDWPAFRAAARSELA